MVLYFLNCSYSQLAIHKATILNVFVSDGSGSALRPCQFSTPADNNNNQAGRNLSASNSAAGNNQREEEEEEDRSSASDDAPISEIRKTFDSHIIVAALIATVTFTAAFTVPGGYVQSGSKKEGMAVLSLPIPPTVGSTDRDEAITSRNHFALFVFADAIAMVLSLSAILIYFLAAFPSISKNSLRKALIYGYILTTFAIIAMVFAFTMALLAVIPAFWMLPLIIFPGFLLFGIVPATLFKFRL